MLDVEDPELAEALRLSLAEAQASRLTKVQKQGWDL